MRECLTEKSLIEMCGWPVFKEARSLHSSGAVSAASFEGNVLRGSVRLGGREVSAGLKFNSATDVDNLCGCRDARVRGILCAHSIAVGLAIVKPREQVACKEPPVQQRPESRPEVPSPASRIQTENSENPRIQLHLEGSLRHLEAELQFEYSRPGVSNPLAESAALAGLVKAGFEDYRGKAALRGEEAVMNFFATQLPEMKRSWQVREGERFQHVCAQLVPIQPRFALQDRGDGWLDFRVHFTAGAEAVFSAHDLRQLLGGGQKGIRLSSGKLALPDPGLLDDIEEVLKDCDPQQIAGGYRVARHHGGFLAGSVEAWGGAAPAARPLPRKEELGTLRNRLRPYQIEGALWLLARAKTGGFGLLADEMGLGKTVQALAMMEATPGPHLVVCPSSLVWNWRKEAQTFVPGFKILTLDGPDRADRFSQIPTHDLAITSYALLRRDIEACSSIPLSSVILDEAQHIKNPDSQNAKAALRLTAKARFILTGTPLENSIRDLWSLFRFLGPGTLGTREEFRDRYEKPISENVGGPVWERLVRRVRPHLLRRRKSELLAELPPKIEQVLEVDLTPAQKAAYSQLQSAARAEVDTLNDQGGAAKMKVLAALLRLRQACCDLRLLGAGPEGSSAKLEALRELLGEASDGGSRVLVFSQFTSMLDLIEQALEEDGMRWCRLDGSTKDREAVVARFQSDSSIPVFLISLKAGGVGLNLTGADTVVHFDPWWNPAAEAQATDRAHRLGQTSVVTSIKLVARDTVEQRVLAMQESKRVMLQDVLDKPMADLNPEDLRSLLAD